jgi:hypothetical protein
MAARYRWTGGDVSALIVLLPWPAISRRWRGGFMHQEAVVRRACAAYESVADERDGTDLDPLLDGEDG